MITDLTVVTLNTFSERFWGVKRFELDHPRLYFPGCQAVHTFGLSQPIHLLWLSRRGRLLRLDKAVKPNRIKGCLGAFGVVEIAATQPLPNYTPGHRFRLQGQALVESAIVMPVLFLLLFGFVELGLMIHEQQQLTYVAQSAAQVGSLTNDDQKITGAVENYYDTDQTTVAVQSWAADGSALLGAPRRYNDQILVQLQMPYALHIPFLPLEAFSLQAQASVRVLCQSVTPPYQCQ